MLENIINFFELVQHRASMPVSKQIKYFVYDIMDLPREITRSIRALSYDAECALKNIRGNVEDFAWNVTRRFRRK